MNESVVQSSPAQHTVVAGNPNWWSINNMRPNHHQNRNSFLSAPPPPPLLTTTSPWNDSDELPESWSQLLLGGLCGEEVKMDNWEKHILNEYSSPKASCVTSLSGSNMLDFSHKSVAGKLHHLHPDPSSHECISRATGGPANKKVRIQPPHQAQSTFKVRKEKLGDRIAALHQLVSPFGKTDTASVLLEAIGYIRFLQSQVEALSLPYLDNGSRNISHQHSVEGEMNCLFPEDPGQEKTDKEARKDLRSRGLCLVPISCTHHIGNENGADYWAFGGNLQ